MELGWIYGFNILINSPLSFFTTLFLVELWMRLLKIKHPRVKACGYFLPFLKVCIDFFLYDYHSWALRQGINPLIAEEGTRSITVMMKPWAGIQCNIFGSNTFTIADAIALSIHPLWIRIAVSIAALGIVLGSIHHLIILMQEKRRLHSIVNKATPLFEARGLQVAATTSLSSPCLIKNTILFPASLIPNLSTAEIEAIIAHEFSHFQWKDSLLRLVCSIIATFFWWIPTRFLQKRIEEAQELAADYSIHRCGISPLALADALLKTAKNHVSPLAPSFASSPLGKRVTMLMQQPFQQSRWQYGLLTALLFFILFGKLWIF